MESRESPFSLVLRSTSPSPRKDMAATQTLARCLDAVMISGMELVRRAISGTLDRQAAQDFESETPARIRQAMARWLQGSLALLEREGQPGLRSGSSPDLEALAPGLGFRPDRGVSILAEELLIAIRPLESRMPRLSPDLEARLAMAWFCLCAVGAIEPELKVRGVQTVLRAVVLESWPELVEQSLRLVAPEPVRPSPHPVIAAPSDPGPLVSSPRGDPSINRRDLLRRPSREREHQATRVVTDLLQRKIAEHALPEPVRDFLHDVWLRHLRTAVLRDGRNSPRFLQALDAVDELIWTLNEQQRDVGRDQLAQRIPALVQTLDVGAKAVGLSAAQMQPFMDTLFMAHMRRMQRSPRISH